MGHKTLIAGTSYGIKSGRTLIGGTGYDIKKGRTLIGGTGYDISFGTPVGELAVGSSVYMNVDGTRSEFIIVHQGNPDPTIYDDSCNGTWVLMKDIYRKYVWDATNNDYENSDVHRYLNNTFLGTLETNIQNAIKQVKIPYLYGAGSGRPIKTGADGLSTKIFLLSGHEVDWTGSNSSSLPADGTKLDYFSSSSGDNSRRIAKYNGSAIGWWLRSRGITNVYDVWTVYDTGILSPINYNNNKGLRPVWIFPQNDVFVADNFNIIPS